MLWALDHLGLSASAIEQGDVGHDLVVDPEGLAVPVEVKARALVMDDDVGRLLAAHDAGAGVLLVVADRITGSARRRLLSEGAGYLDLRGRLALRAQGLLIEAEVPSLRQESPAGTHWPPAPGWRSPSSS